MKQEHITCKECKWSLAMDEHVGVGTRWCHCPKFKDVSEDGAEDIDDDGFAIHDAEKYRAGFYVGENFGCIHGVRK